MKQIIVIAVLILFSFPAYPIGFGNSKDIVVKIRTGKKEYTFIKLSELPIVYDFAEKEAHAGFHYRTQRDHVGKYKMIFLPLKTFEFDTEAQFEEWIDSIYPKIKCLTISGLEDCD